MTQNLQDNITVNMDSARQLRAFHGKKHRHQEEEFLEEGFGPMLSSNIVIDFQGEQNPFEAPEFVIDFQGEQNP